MLVAGVKSEAPGDNLDTLLEGCVTLFENEPETNESWDTEEVVQPTLPFGLKLVLVCTRLNTDGTLHTCIHVQVLKGAGSFLRFPSPLME